MSTASFRQQIRNALANATLQAALDANAERRSQARRQAFASLTEPLETLRRRAHAMRAETITHLDDYLDQFVAAAEANGMTVHRAATAAEANQLTLEIIKKSAPRNAERKETTESAPSTSGFPEQSASRLIAKSKSMLSEEIRLNHALEAAGHRVVETDLGEYIVQLRGERPSHIITPAVHLRRQEVAATFHQKLGIPYTEEIETLTAAARKTLREIFLTADIGISGVNFGVAESGTLCLVTNEGNGRMVTTLPPVHIALMGLERLVPTMADLALMLELLPRSATGQKISVYVSLIHGPRGASEIDGPRERHLILIDNGRSALRQSPFAEALYCIRCGACLNACPVFREIGGHAYVGGRGQPAPYPGPIGSIISPTLFGVSDFGHLAQASTLCGACREACPVAIDLPKLLLRLRARTEDGRSASPTLPHLVRGGLRLYSWLACNSGRFAVAQKVASALGRVLSPHSEWLRLPDWTGWGLGRDFPRPSANTKGQPKPQKPSVVSGLDIKPPSASPTPKQGNILQQFTDELTALGGSVTHCAPETLGGNLLQFLQDRGFNKIFAWEDDHLPAGLTTTLREAGIRLVTAPQPDVQAGLTGALGAVAGSGTLVVPSDPGQPASASLLPEIHLAILEAKHIYPHLIDVLTLPQIREHSAVALISGPSRTADIEMKLTIGVHGPREVHLFVI